MRLTKKSLMHMGWITLIGFGVLGYIIIHFFQDRNVLDLLLLDSALSHQILLGIVSGLLITQIILLIVEQSWFKPTRHFFVDLLGPVKLSFPAIVFISFCAGFGEELFFRGAIQHWLGIWITAVLFVLLHGYLNPKNLNMSLYAILLILASAAFGYLAEYFGLLSAMIAHMTYDVVMFLKINHYHKLRKDELAGHQN